MDKEEIAQEAKILLIGKSCEFCGYRQEYQNGISTCVIKNGQHVSLDYECPSWILRQKMSKMTAKEVIEREG